VTGREAHVLICAALLRAGFGLVRLTDFRAALCAAGFCLGVYGGYRFLARKTLAPNMQLSYSLARYVDGVLQEKERAIIVAKPIPPRQIQDYLDKVYVQGGGAGLASAESNDC
jgi:hypothetical protein